MGRLAGQWARWSRSDRKCDQLCTFADRAEALRELLTGPAVELTLAAVARPSTRVALASCLVLLSACISSRQTLTPEAARVRYLEGKLEPECAVGIWW